MTLPFEIPGTVEAVVAAVDLRTGLALRNHLRRLRDRGDALLALLFVTGHGQCDLLEYAGDRAAMPAPMPLVTSTVTSFETLPCVDSESRDAALLVVRLGRGWPTLGLALITPARPAPELADAMEECGARLEAALIGALARRGRRGPA